MNVPTLPLSAPRLPQALLCAAAALALAGCALQRPPAAVADAPVPAGWQAPLPPAEGAAPAAPSAMAPAGAPPVAGLPHGGTGLGLARWWERLDDPLLLELIAAAQDVSPNVAQAASRIGQARASRVAAGAALGPTLDAAGNASRGFQPQFLQVATIGQATLQASWEPDVFGGNRAARDAAQARLAGAQAGWHDARVSVAAETARQLALLRACRAQQEVARQDAASRAETARLSDLSTRAGFQAPADDALARASAADASNRLTQQRAQCDIAVKGLVALTGLDEGNLRSRLDAARVPEPPSALFSIASLPAEVLAQRPDVFQAEQEVAAVSAEVGQAEAQRYPRLTVGGSIGKIYYSGSTLSGDASTWSVGPLQLSLPLFDGGRRVANAESVRTRYGEAADSYRARVRQAVREVEEALVNLQATADRAGDADTAARGYRDAFEGTQARYKAGLTSLLQMEDARRTALAAENTLVQLRRERMDAWIALYRAAGGGWDRAQDPAAADAAARALADRSRPAPAAPGTPAAIPAVPPAATPVTAAASARP
jgi:NodT family efflux transporter outer membrane factor (OMF) lipoprotein